MRLRLFIGCLLVALLAACGSPTSAPSPSPEPTTNPAVIGLTYIPNVQFSPFYVADQTGQFSKPITLRHHGASEGLFTALTTGAEQFVVAGGDEMAQARSEHIDLIAVASYYRQYPVRIIVPADSPIQSAADLKGRKVGVPGRYGETWFGLKFALSGVGLTEQDVSIQEIGYTQQAALMTGKVDAVMGFVNSDAVQFASSGFATRSFEVGQAVPLVSISLVTTKAYADTHPDVVRAIAAGMVAGMKAVAANPDQAMTISKAYVPGLSDPATATSARAVLDATIPLFKAPDSSIDGHFDLDQWEQMSQAMVGAGLLPKPEAAASMATNGYL